MLGNYIFKRRRNRQNAVNFRRANARVKRECRSAKRRTWERFLNSLDLTMDVKYLWKKVNNLRNHRMDNFPTILNNGNNQTHPQQIADCFAEFWSSLSSDNAFNPAIINEKKELRINELDGYNENFNGMISKIDLFELNEVLKTLKGSTPADDKITYAMVRNSTAEFKYRLCELYNSILESGSFTHQWKTAILTPIPKPNKNPNQDS